MSAATTFSWIKSPVDGWKRPDFSSSRCQSLFGSFQTHWLANIPDPSLLRVKVAADYPDSLSDSADHVKGRGYHPLEEVKEHVKNKDFSLTVAETARTTAEANNKALLVFPGAVHSEPHRHAAWAEYQYVVDDYGDVFFEVFDTDNLLRSREGNNPVTVFVGADALPIRESSAAVEYSDVDSDGAMDMFQDDEFDEFAASEVADILVEWGMPETLRQTHPLYFAKRITRAVQMSSANKLDWPSNMLTIVGYLRPAFAEEESYLRSLFHSGDENDGYTSNWEDGEVSSFDFGNDGSVCSMIYKLEIMTMELLSICGNQYVVDLHEFQDAEPDVLATSASAIIRRVNEFGTQSTAALRSLCRRRKGLTVEGAKLIGVDSLGIDVRAFWGTEARTLRFSFNGRATSESAAERKIKRMLYPRYHRKNQKTASIDRVGEL